MKLFSNEIVFRGHPDKVCDQISDAILKVKILKRVGEIYGRRKNARS